VTLLIDVLLDIYLPSETFIAELTLALFGDFPECLYGGRRVWQIGGVCNFKLTGAQIGVDDLVDRLWGSGDGSFKRRVQDAHVVMCFVTPTRIWGSRP
jgi:hypothetical protein